MRTIITNKLQRQLLLFIRENNTEFEKVKSFVFMDVKLPCYNHVDVSDSVMMYDINVIISLAVLNYVSTDVLT